MQMYSPVVLLRRVNRKSFWNGGGDHEHVGTIALQGGIPGCHLLDRKSPSIGNVGAIVILCSLK